MGVSISIKSKFEKLERSLDELGNGQRSFTYTRAVGID
jgi:hypothetical protein